MTRTPDLTIDFDEHSFAVIESDIPEGMTVSEYRRSRSTRTVTVTLEVSNLPTTKADSLLRRLLSRRNLRVLSID